MVRLAGGGKSFVLFGKDLKKIKVLL